jgi:hypothetical protein
MFVELAGMKGFGGAAHRNILEGWKCGIDQLKLLSFVLIQKKVTK